MKYGIIAAGEGSRLTKDGFNGYKPEVIVNNETLLQRLIRIFSQNNAEEIFIIINEKEKELVPFINKIHSSVPIHIFIKNTESSVHSFFEIVKDQPCIDEICVSTVDAIFNEEEFEQYIKAFNKDKGLDGLMAVTHFIDDDSPLYIDISDSDIINEFSSHAIISSKGASTVSGGIYCLRNKAINLTASALQSGISKMRNYQQELINHGLTLKGFFFSKIIDIDHLSDIEKANKFLSAQSQPQL